MKYRIEKTGGFLGLHQTFEGELQKIDNALVHELKAHKSTELNPNLRDGFVYRIVLDDDEFHSELTIDESTMSPAFEKLIRIAEKE